MSITLDRQVNLVAALPAQPVTRPAVLARPDGTILVAWDDGQLRLWHLTGTGDTITERTIPGSGARLILAPTTDPARALLLADGTAHVIDAAANIASSTPAPTPATGSILLTVSPFLHDETVAAVVAYGGIYTYTATGTHAGTWPLPDTFPVAAWSQPGRIVILTLDGTVWAATPTGATQVGTVDTAGYTAIGGTDPTADESATLASGGPLGGRLLKGGAVVAEDGMGDLDRVDLGQTATTSLGGVTASEWSTDAAFDPSSVLFHHYTPAGDLSTVRVDLPHRLVGLFSNAAPVVSHHGGRVAVVHHLVDTANNDARHLILWLLTVPGGDEPPAIHDGILAIDTVDQGRWWVGTRDPSMAYELVIDTATQRLVEVVAGEESLATHDLLVSDGLEWHVAALMRPDA